jgi:ribosomal protein S17
MSRQYMNISLAKVEAIARDFAATQKDIEAAARRAVSKTSRWVGGLLVRMVARETGIQQKTLRPRLRIYTKGNHMTARVFFGASAIPLAGLNPRQTASGVVAGKIERRRAFIAQNKNDERQVYRRIGRERQPLAIQYAHIDKEVDYAVINEVLPLLESRFYRIFEQELRWETRKK